MGLVPDTVLTELASAPKAQATDEGKNTERDMTDVIAGDRYIAGRSVVRPWNGMQVSKIVGPSTV